jgi:hypothetical protein
MNSSTTSSLPSAFELRCQQRLERILQERSFPSGLAFRKILAGKAIDDLEFERSIQENVMSNISSRLKGSSLHTMNDRTYSLLDALEHEASDTEVTALAKFVRLLTETADSLIETSAQNEGRLDWLSEAQGGQVNGSRDFTLDAITYLRHRVIGRVQLDGARLTARNWKRVMDSEDSKLNGDRAAEAFNLAKDWSKIVGLITVRRRDEAEFLSRFFDGTPEQELVERLSQWSV